MKKAIKFMLITSILLIILAAIILNLPVFGKNEVTEKMKNSKNWNGKEFVNLEHTPAFAENVSFYTVFFDFFFGKKDPLLVPKNPIPSIKTNLNNLKEKQLVWFGHSSYIFKLNNKIFLVDPVLSGNASPVPGSMKSFPGSDIYTPQDFPEIDFLIISHDHYDHLDYKTIKALIPKVNHAVTSLGVGQHLKHWGMLESKITELDWYENTILGDLKITSTPARHFSGRSLKRNNTLWSSYVLESPDFKMFIGGDSGYGKHFKEIGEKFGPFDLVILENGQYNVFWKYIHTLPDELLIVYKDLNAKAVFPVHSSKFALAKHAWNEPLELAFQNATKENIPILTPKIGEILDMADKSQTFEPWWRQQN